MVWTNIGLSGTALAIGSYSPNRPQWMRIGSGSGTSLVTLSGLYAETGSPTTFTAVDVTALYKVTFQGDWTAALMSGLSLNEFIVSTGSAGYEPWVYENLGDAITFDGTNELRVEVEVTWY